MPEAQRFHALHGEHGGLILPMLMAIFEQLAKTIQIACDDEAPKEADEDPSGRSHFTVRSSLTIPRRFKRSWEKLYLTARANATNNASRVARTPIT